MPEEILFEIPEVRITTERIIFCNATFEIGYVASTNVHERMTGWSNVLWYVAFFGMAFLLLHVFQFLGVWESVIFMALFMALAFIIPFLEKRLPHEHVLTLKMKDKMFYEVVTRTSQEVEIIQGHVNEAMARYKETPEP